MSTEDFTELSLMPGALGELHASITDAIARVDGRIERASKSRAPHWVEIRAGLVDAREQIEAQYTERRLPMSHECAAEVCQGMPLDTLDGADWTDRWPCAEWDAKSGKWILEFVLEGTDQELADYGIRPVVFFPNGTIRAVPNDAYRDGYIAEAVDIDAHNAALAAKGGAK